jgi:uncharacterized membrane protein YedE/YeeE
MGRPFNVIAYCMTWWSVFIVEALRGRPLWGFGIATLAGVFSAFVVPHPDFLLRPRESRTKPRS